MCVYANVFLLVYKSSGGFREVSRFTQEPPLKTCVCHIQLMSGRVGDTLLLADAGKVVEGVAKC